LSWNQRGVGPFCRSAPLFTALQSIILPAFSFL
jgi:hypothetical protein